MKFSRKSGAMAIAPGPTVWPVTLVFRPHPSRPGTSVPGLDLD